MRALSLLALAACGAPFTDPDLTGILIRPTAGEHPGPDDLGVRNGTGEAITCSVWDLDECPAMGTIGEIPVGDRWELADVTCVGVDVACWAVGDPVDQTPLRHWTWSIKPEEEE